VSNDSLGHAYLFTGPEMIGKKSFALELFEMINGRSSVGDPDFLFAGPDLADGDAKIYIEDIRKLKSFFRFKPYYGPYKFALIDDAHCLTNESANALLKILEEPPGFSVLVLVSSMAKMLPKTIVSRCEKIRFAEVGGELMEDYLNGFKNLKKEDKDFLLRLAGGRIGFASYLLKEDKLGEARKAIDDLRKLLNARVYEKFNYAKKIHERGGGYQSLVGYWLSWVASHVQSSPKNEKIVKELLVLNSIVSQPQYNHRLALENFLLNL
jgi:DNA polymerase III delta prime subunit